MDVAGATGAVLVLNASYEPLQKVTTHHAINMLIRKVAVISESVEGKSFGPYPMPKVLVLLRFIKLRWEQRRREPRWSKAGVHARDRRCAYCGKGKAESVDHVVPVSRGGLSSWTNTVSACLRCNQRKADKTPAEAGMRLLWEPYVPTFATLA